MAVILRLKRFGKRSQPTYRLVAIDESERRQGKEIEALGHYDPNFNPPKISLSGERIKYWLSVGAKASDTVNNILKKNLSK